MAGSKPQTIQHTGNVHDDMEADCWGKQRFSQLKLVDLLKVVPQFVS